MKVNVLKYQNYFDIAVQETGITENAFEIAAANNMSVSDNILPAIIDIPDTLNKDRNIVSRITAGRFRPATSVTDNDIGTVPYKGIGFMTIGIDFIVK